MRSPHWILTSVLLLFFVLVTIILLVTRGSIPHRISLRVQAGVVAPLKDVSKINVARIYENDLFNTYIAPVPKKVEQEYIIQIPQPPVPQLPPAPQVSRPQFFDPLDITLKGVIYAYDDRDNRAIVADNKTKTEQLYKIGDRIADADIIHIGKNKIVFLRSNGQQETVFITQAAAQLDPIFAQDAPWSLVIKKITDQEYYIDPKAFISRIASPAQFLDMLDLTTAFDKGRSVGLRVGKMDQRSVGRALGLQYGDIIMRANGIDTTTTQDRMTIFEKLKTLVPEDLVVLQVQRADSMLELRFVMKNFDDQVARAPEYGEQIFPGQDLAKTSSMIVESHEEKKREQVVAQKTIPGSTLKLAKKQDRHVMVHRGGRANLLQRMPSDQPIT